MFDQKREKVQRPGKIPGLTSLLTCGSTKRRSSCANAASQARIHGLTTRVVDWQQAQEKYPTAKAETRAEEL